MRRAALDGLIDYNYWFGIGRNPIPTEQFSPAMLEAIRKMLSDPAESWWVVDGALMALKFAPAKDIQALQAADHAVDEALGLVAARVRLHGPLGAREGRRPLPGDPADAADDGDRRIPHPATRADDESPRRAP